MKEWLEYAAAWAGVKFLGLLPRSVARLWAPTSPRCFLSAPAATPHRHAQPHTGFSDWSDARRRQAIRGMVRQVGWMVGEFSQFPEYTRQNIERIVILDGFENFDAARRRGKGVLFLTGHMSAWELAPFAHAFMAIRFIFSCARSPTGASTR